MDNLAYLIGALNRELNRIRRHALDGPGTTHVINGLESFLKSIGRLRKVADLEAWFRSQQAEDIPEGLSFDRVTALIEKGNIKEDVIRCFWDGSEETRPEKGRPLTIWRCRHPEMASNIYTRYVAANGQLPNNCQIPISFAMQLYAEFVLHKHVNYKSMRPGSGAGKGRMGTQRIRVRRREEEEFGDMYVPPPLRRMRGCVEENVQAAASSTQDEPTRSTPTPSSVQRSSSSPTESSSPVGSEPKAPSEEIGNSRLPAEESGQRLEEGGQGFHEGNLLFREETRNGLQEHNLHIEAAQNHQELKQQIQILKEQLNEASWQETQEMRQQLEETRQQLQEIQEMRQQLEETRQQLRERDALLEETKGLLEARDREIEETTLRHLAQDKELREEIIGNRIALHNARHLVGQCAYLGHHVFEHKATPSIALHLIDPMDLLNRPALSDMVRARVLDHICGICRVDFDCLGWFTLGCGHSFHLHCITQHLARVAACQFCKTAVPLTLYKSIGMDDLYPANP